MSDLISRQAAIRWVKTECNPYGKPTFDFESGKKVIEHLKQMPSAQPEQQIPQMRGRVCPVCGRGLSPYTSVCPCNNGKGWEITC